MIVTTRSTLATSLVLLSLAACGDNFRLSGQIDASGSGSNDDASLADDASITTDGALPTIPTVTANAPADGTADFALNGTIRAFFSEPMDPATLTTSTFTLTVGNPAVAVPGIIVNGVSKATFRPSLQLAANRTFTATITTGAKSAAGVALAASHSWSFTTGATAAGEPPVELGTAGNFVILAKSGISSIPPSVITGDIAVSPATATAITGFDPITLNSTGVFATASQVNGKIFAANYMVPTPSNLTTAIGDMETAFTDAAARAPTVTGLPASIGGLTLAPGVYKFSTAVLIPTNVTLAGSATDVWIFQIAQNFQVSSNARVLLSGGAKADNVFWQASGQVTIGTGGHVEGNVIGQTSIVLQTGSSLNGRVLAQTAITLDKSTLVRP